MFEERMRKHADHIERMLDEDPDLRRNEAQTNNVLIHPFLELLGYPAADPRYVKTQVLTDKGERVDYELTTADNAKIVVEAKSADTTFTPKEINQLKDYFHWRGAKVGILTDGVKCWLFVDSIKQNVMDSEPYRRIDFKSLGQNDIRSLELLTRNGFDIDSIREQVLIGSYQQQVATWFKEQQTNPSNDLVTLVGRAIGIKPMNKKAREMLKPSVKKAFRDDKEGTFRVGKATTQSPSPSSSTLVTPLSPHKVNSDQRTSSGTVRKEILGAGRKAAITRARFKGANLFGVALAATSYRAVLIAVVEEMHRRHPQQFAETVGGDAFVGRKWRLISMNRDHVAPDLNPTSVCGGSYWLHTHLSREGAIKRAQKFLKEFGHRSEDLVILTTD